MISEKTRLSKILEDFYSLYLKIGTGIITDFNGGAILYDKVEAELGKIVIESTIKKQIWKDCIKNYNLFYSHKGGDDSEKRKYLEEYYKSSLLEEHLNSMLKPDNGGNIIVLEL